MAKVMTDESNYSAIASQIRSKLGVSTRYKPSEMAAAIGSISGLSSSDNGKVVVDGQLTQQTSRSVSQNGTYDTTTNNEVVVNVSDGDNPFALTEYIESSGTQYIDTGYLPTDNTSVEVVANAQRGSNNYPTLFGMRPQAYSTSGTHDFIIHFYSSTDRATLFQWNTGIATVNYTKYVNQKAVFQLGQNGYGIESEPYTLKETRQLSGSINGIYSLYIFNFNNMGAVFGNDAACIMKLYRFRVYENDALVMELLPYEDNGEACLKDSVTGNLFKNAGTGSFVLGTD